MNYLVDRVILILKNKDVKKISNIVINQLLDNAYIYTSINSLDLIKR